MLSRFLQYFLPKKYPQKLAQNLRKVYFCAELNLRKVYNQQKLNLRKVYSLCLKERFTTSYQKPSRPIYSFLILSDSFAIMIATTDIIGIIVSCAALKSWNNSLKWNTVNTAIMHAKTALMVLQILPP